MIVSVMLLIWFLVGMAFLSLWIYEKYIKNTPDTGVLLTFGITCMVVLLGVASLEESKKPSWIYAIATNYSLPDEEIRLLGEMIKVDYRVIGEVWIFQNKLLFDDPVLDRLSHGYATNSRVYYVPESKSLMQSDCKVKEISDIIHHLLVDLLWKNHKRFTQESEYLREYIRVHYDGGIDEEDTEKLWNNI